MMLNLAYHQPKNLADVATLLKNNPGARIVAGGTDLLVKIRNGIIPGITGLIDINRLNLCSIRRENGVVTIGARCTMSQICAHEMIVERFPALVAAARTVGAPQIRNAATIGGNVGNASPAGDTIPALYSLEAVVVLFGADERRKVPIQEFFTGPGKTVLQPGEVIEAFELPEAPSVGAFLKLGERRAHAISKINLAISVWSPEASPKVRIALGSVAPTVIRVPAAEKLLEGATWPWSAEIVAKAADAAVEAAKPIDDIRSYKGYRKKMAAVLLKRACGNLLS